jgi:hypothetical protein
MKITKLLLLSLAVVLFSCSEEDDPKPEDGLIGAWSVTALNYEGTTISTVLSTSIISTFTGVAKNMAMTVTFKQNPNIVTSEGSYTIALTTTTLGQSITEDFTFTDFISDGTWSLNDKKITVTNAGVTQEATIVSQTSTTLVLALETEQSQDLAGVGSVTTNVEGVYTLTKK